MDHLETLCKVLNFFMGMLTMYLLRVGWTRYRNWRGGDHTMPTLGISKRALTWVGVILILFGSIFVGVQSNNTDKAVRDLTLQTQDCYRQFSEALQARTKIAAEDKAVYQKQRDALVANDEAMLKWLSTLLNPPPDIAALPQQDQRRRDWGIAITQEFNNVMTNSRVIVAQAREQEQKSDAERQQHPLPQPTCGMQ